MLTTKQGTWTYSDVAAWMQEAREGFLASPTAHKALKAILGGIANEVQIRQARTWIERAVAVHI
jgi:hypothetical protein